MARGWERDRTGGFSGVDLVIALALVLALAAIAIPLTTHVVDAGRTRQAAAFLAARIRLARVEAIRSRRTTALVFDELTPAAWSIRTCQDSNGNGVRRAEITSGVDVCLGPSERLARKFPGVEIGIAGHLPGPEGDPPGTNPVRFGNPAMASCAALGGCTPGTVFVQSRGGDHYAVRVGSATGRTRVLHYSPGSSQWALE